MASAHALDCACHENLSAVKIEAYHVVTGVLWSLALVNQTFFSKGWGRNRQEVLDLPIRPAGLEERLGEVVEGKDGARVAEDCYRLVDEVRQLIAQEQRRLEPVSMAAMFAGFFEEAKSTFNRIRRACREQDRDTAWFGAAQIQAELTSMLDRAGSGHAGTHGLPDLLAAFDAGGLDGLATATGQLEVTLLALLGEAGVAILELASIDQLRQHLRELGATSKPG